jgi:hypothetical protein
MVTLHNPRRPSGSPALRVAAIAAAGLIALAACTAGSGGPGASASAGAETPSRVPASRQVPLPSPAPGSDTGAVPDEILQAAVADAAKQTGVDPSAITVASAEPVTWPNGALGCPEPGVMYTQALVPGYRITLEVGGRQLDYHASESGTVKLCTGLAG